MLIGVNATSPASLPLARKLVQRGEADFIELMVDNFIHLAPSAIRQALPEIPIAFHLVASRFLEQSEQMLALLASRLREWIGDLQPLYVSDHLVQFTRNDCRLPMIRELDYVAQYEHIVKRVNTWQAMLAAPLLLENHASLGVAGQSQPVFFQKLLWETGAGLLFDLSNAWVAGLNGAVAWTGWSDLMLGARHLHIAGFRQDRLTGLQLDTHDRPLDEQVLALLSLCAARGNAETVVLECDASRKECEWRRELMRVRQALVSPAVIPNSSGVAEAKTGIQVSLEQVALKQRILKRAPKTSVLLADIQAFLSWSDEQQLSRGWSLPLHLLSWLMQEVPNQVTDEIKKELMLAAAIEWSLQGFEHPAAQGLLLASPFLPGLGVAIWKPELADAPPRRVILETGSVAATQAGHVYRLTGRQGVWEQAEWVVVPR